MIDSRKLIDVARQLNGGQDDNAPESEAIRRAVSTAYYALFHAVLKEAAERFVGANDTSVAFEAIYRGFNHKDINQVFVAIDKSTLSPTYRKILRRTSVSQGMRDFAAFFVSMQEFRHLADYNPLVQISQSEAESLIEDAASALQSFANADATEKTDLFAIMLAGTRAT